MADQLKGVRVFIASPGGLKDEREAFKEVIDRVNYDHAIESGVNFVAAGWEYTSSGVGRPQSKINEHVKRSDYLVVLLWDKWGRPPGDGRYTSGTEEEYRVALECLLDENMPMRDIVVLFKAVGERQLADPGEDLKKVLAFKTELEESRVLLYSTFDSLEKFRDDFRQHLHNWVRDWQGDEPPRKKLPSDDAAVPDPAPIEPVTIEPSPVDESATPASLAALGKAAADRGRSILAEQLFARAISGVYNREAYTEYVRFLRKSGRLNPAEDTAHEFLDLAQDADDLVGEIEALANLSILDRQKGANGSSLLYIARAVSAADEWVSRLKPSDEEDRRSALSTKAFLLDNKSLTLRRIPGRAEDALAALAEAQALQEDLGDKRGSSFTLRNIGSLQLRMGRLEEGERALSQSLAIFEDIGYPSGQATAMGSLGELYEAQGDLPRAIEMVNGSIAVSPNRALSRFAMAWATLARLHVKSGDVDTARSSAEKAMRAAQELGTREGLATALHARGLVDLASGEVDEAVRQFRESLATFRQVDNPVGIAAVSIDLARAELRRGDPEEALRLLDRARELLEEAPHHSLTQELVAAEQEARKAA